jgi:hypothetical protein
MSLDDGRQYQRRPLLDVEGPYYAKQARRRRILRAAQAAVLIFIGYALLRLLQGG